MFSFGGLGYCLGAKGPALKPVNRFPPNSNSCKSTPAYIEAESLLEAVLKQATGLPGTVLASQSPPKTQSDPNHFTAEQPITSGRRHEGRGARLCQVAVQHRTFKCWLLRPLNFRLSDFGLHIEHLGVSHFALSLHACGLLQHDMKLWVSGTQKRGSRVEGRFLWVQLAAC